MVHARLLVSVAVGRDRYATPGLWLAAAGAGCQAYAPALGHLADIDGALGAHQ